MPKLYGYARASTREQVDTLAIQEEGIKRYLEYRYGTGKQAGPDAVTFGGQFTDRGVSGDVPISHRPEGLKMMASLERGDIIVATKLDRAFRNLRDLVQTVYLLEERGISLVLLDLNIDTATTTGKLMLHLLGAVAEFERSRLRERCVEALAQRRKRKNHSPNGCLPPYGFTRTGPKGRRCLRSYPLQRQLGSLIVKLVDEELMTFEAVYFHLLKHRIRFRKVNRRRTEVSQQQVIDFYHGEKNLQAKEKASREQWEARAKARQGKGQQAQVQPAPDPKGSQEEPDEQPNLE